MVQQGYGLGRDAHQSQPKSCGPHWQVAQSYRLCTFAIDDAVPVADDVLVYVNSNTNGDQSARTYGSTTWYSWTSLLAFMPQGICHL